ncbi:hypothetical protein [Aliivibrio fischeri]|uniref:hypothetical protein n=1 Tax=Aliivibrio fischeri TaxID=668 RepID=UPI0012907997|nr:hypothetical protein [Aliivibrio fischeri]
MKYKEFKKNIDITLLSALGAIKYIDKFIDIELLPDYNLTDYDKYTNNTYFIRQRYDFSEDFSSLFYASIDNTAIFNWEDIKDNDLQVDQRSSISGILNKMPKNKIEFINSVDPDDLDDFKLNSLKVDSINSIEHELVILGAFLGNSYSIDPSDWSLVSNLKLLGIPSNLNGKLYLELLAESYSLLQSGNNKLSYFLLYTAFESYINIHANPSNDSVRLKDSFQKLFKSKFGVINANDIQIYSSIVGYFDGFYRKRNDIAHGRNMVSIGDEELQDFLIFVLTVIVANENSIHNFKRIVDEFT